MAQQVVGVPAGDWAVPNLRQPSASNPENWFSLCTKLNANFAELYAGGGGALANQYNALINTASFTATAAEMASAQVNVMDLTGTLAGAANVTTDTAAALFAALPNAKAGSTCRLRIINNSSGAFAWTLVGGTGVTIDGTATINQHTYRDFLVSVVSAAAVTIQNIGSGTN